MSGVFWPIRQLYTKPPPGTQVNPGHSLLRGCLALWPTIEQGGNTIFDVSGNANHAVATAISTGAYWGNGGGTGTVITGAPTNKISGASPIFGTPSVYWKAPAFADNLGTMAVSMWIRPNSAGNGVIYLGKFGSGGTAAGQGWAICVDVQAAGYASFLTQVTGGATYRQFYPTTPTGNTFNNGWTHYVFNIASYLVSSIYVNGVSATVTADSGNSGTVTTTTNSSNVLFGAGYSLVPTDEPSGTNYFDSTGIWNRNLNVNEVQSLFLDPWCYMRTQRRNLISAGIFKETAAAQNITDAGITSLEGLGAPKFTLGVGPGGIVSSEVIGLANAGKTIIMAGVTSEEDFGNNAGAYTLLIPGGATSLEAVGAIGVSEINETNIFADGITSAEAVGALLGYSNVNPGAMTSLETFGAENAGIVLNMLGISTGEFLGALKAALSLKGKFNYVIRNRNRLVKPLAGCYINSADSISQGLVFANLFNEGGGAPIDLITGKRGVLNDGAGSEFPNWIPGQFGATLSMTGNDGNSKIQYAEQAQWIDTPFSSSGMHVSFWARQNAASLVQYGTFLSKSDRTNGSPGQTAGWNVNMDIWSGAPAAYMKLEFERSINNKMAGINQNLLSSGWHHISIGTPTGANNSNPTLDDFVTYLDGTLITGNYLLDNTQTQRAFWAGTGTGTTSDATYPLYVGYGGNGGCEADLDVVLIHNRVLTPLEVKRLNIDPFCFIARQGKPISGKIITSPQTLFMGSITSFERFGLAMFAKANSVTPGGIASLASLGAIISAIVKVIYKDILPNEDDDYIDIDPDNLL